VSCERHRQALVDAALGIAETPELLRHLAECARCSAQLERQRGLLARIDGEIQTGMDESASPAFVARVRQRAAQRKPQPWRVHAWLLPLAAGIGVVALGVPRMWRRPQTTPPPLASVADQARPPAQAVPAPPQEPAAPSPAMPPPPRPASARPSEPEVLLRPGEAAFVRKFADAARQQPVRAAVLVQAGFDPGNEEPALRATPIAPLDPPRGAILRLDEQRGAIQPLPTSREEIRPLSIPPAEPRPGPGDQPPSERQ